ncbi:anti-sigma factor [Variovorax soli]|uniref:Anti-sigma factor RsiW n=1 Tax=Variovorax soli TaxID=376815 RepID=A0ABU1NFK5_9BURK|nr:anti-sigma factor [Variovorax soli]MDR6536816.1 anti-sigma factor RsiW [Variovorax soli]
MNCEHALKVLDAHLDDELDTATSAQVVQHLAACPACAARLAERSSLRAALRQLPREPAPAALRRAIQHTLTRVEDAGRAGRSRSVGWWQALLLAGATASLAFVVGLWVGAPRDPDLSEQLVARHVASLARSDALVAVLSEDRHVVKPWFAGKLDFAPPVRDLGSQGFTLIGGRLDHLGGQPAAALVYRIRRHEITLFVTRAASAAQEAPVESTLRGFSLLTWSAGGLRFAAISDVEPRDLRRFGELVRAPAD